MAKTAFIAVSHSEMNGTHLPKEVYAILQPILFSKLKEGQWSYDILHKKDSNKTHVIKVYEGKATGTQYWSTNCGKNGDKLRKNVENLKRKPVEVSFPPPKATDQSKPQLDINFHLPNRTKPFKVRVQDTGTNITYSASDFTKTDMREDATLEFIKKAVQAPSKYIFEAGRWDKVMSVDKGKFYKEVIKIFPLS